MKSIRPRSIKSRKLNNQEKNKRKSRRHDFLFFFIVWFPALLTSRPIVLQTDGGTNPEEERLITKQSRIARINQGRGHDRQREEEKKRKLRKLENKKPESKIEKNFDKQLIRLVLVVVW